VEYTALRNARATSLLRRRSSRVELPALSAWILAFALVTYLAMRDGGYDTIVRSEVGVAVWWIALLAALAGFLPARLGRAGWAAIGLLAGFAAWTGLAATWSVSPGDTITEFGRESAYLGFLVLAIILQGRTAARHTIHGLACAIGLVTALAVLSRLHPEWFPANEQFQFLGAQAARRLSYPLNYWNALAAFSAMGVPLLASVAVSARRVVVRALAAATLPLCALCVYMTVSRGGVLELGVGVVVFLALVPRRFEAVGTLLLGAAGSAILVWACSDRPAIRTGLRTPAALHQGSAVLVLAIVTCAGVALLQAAVALATEHLVPPTWARPGRRATLRAGVALLATFVAVGSVAGVPARLVHLWDEFKTPTGVVVPSSDATVFSRLSAVNGNGRYQYWVAAVHANATHPWTGIGPGTFQYWWSAHATTDGSVLNAHSLYLETLAETGIIGVALIGGLLLWFFGIAVRRSLFARTPASLRVAIAAAGAGLAAFMTAAALEWVWQMAAIAAAALLLGAVIVAGRDEAPATTPARRPPRIASGAIVLLAVFGLAAVAVPLAGAVAIRASQNAAATGDLVDAYRDSLTAERIEPYAAEPRLQEALVLEAAGDYRPAAVAAQEATRDARTNWQAWLTLARIDVQSGMTGAGVTAFDRARALDPRNVLWQEGAS
jgi:hypothetical protein